MHVYQKKIARLEIAEKNASVHACIGLKVKLMINCINVKLSAQQILQLKKVKLHFSSEITGNGFVSSRGSLDRALF